MFKPMDYDLNEVLVLFREKRTLELRGLSNRLIREAAAENDYVKAELGVIAYALHKIESKSHFVNSPIWGKIKASVFKNIESAIFASKQKKTDLLLSYLKKIIGSINEADSNLGYYASSIYDKAKVKQASLAYSYGLSISQAAALVGADKKELQNYIGYTTMHDEEMEAKGIVKRVSELKELLEKNGVNN
ncbi:MAG: hypothetical protein GX950_01530 [Candidatus Diapherotrites archaeon]|jgi:hypothetical protein|uniref:Uncharacterized protein n=1 Tax=Candidatus Iainarchaeum sp. TaxID=3101447 RepID=A0A7K4BYZ0_9ARCH|nr:hypothetical protein [Candidatus Diapherotrites archaeon]